MKKALIVTMAVLFTVTLAIQASFAAPACCGGEGAQTYAPAPTGAPAPAKAPGQSTKAKGVLLSPGFYAPATASCGGGCGAGPAAAGCCGGAAVPAAAGCCGDGGGGCFKLFKNYY